MKTDIHLWSYLTEFFLEWEMFQTKVVEKMKTYILCSIFFFTENLVIYEIMCKNIVQRDKATFNNAAHAHCMLDT